MHILHVYIHVSGLTIGDNTLREVELIVVWLSLCKTGAVVILHADTPLVRSNHGMFHTLDNMFSS